MTPQAEQRGGKPQGLPAGLPRPAQRALADAGYATLEQVAAATEADLARMHGIGPKAIRHLRAALAAAGLEFTRMTPDQFGALFERFRRSAFRLEARDEYNVPDEQEDLAAFLDGREVAPGTPENDPWLALVARATATGRTFTRVRIVGRPITSYTRFEFAGYPANVAAGEVIRVAERAWLHDADNTWANEDFWLFDDQTVIKLRYDRQGRFLGAEPDSNLDAYLSARQRALALSVDLGKFTL